MPEAAQVAPKAAKQAKTFVAIYHDAKDQIIVGCNLVFPVSGELVSMLKKAVMKRWPDGCVVAHVYGARDEKAAEYRKPVAAS